MSIAQNQGALPAGKEGPVADGAHRCGCGRAAARGWAKLIARVTGVALPTVVLALIPKCPACLAAYVALGTGVGLSLQAAEWLRWLLVGAAAAMLGYFGQRVWRDRTWLRREASRSP